MQSFTVRADIVKCGIPGVTPCLGYTTWGYGNMVLCKKLFKKLDIYKTCLFYQVHFITEPIRFILKAPFWPVGSFQLKIFQFPVLLLYFFPTPTPCHASLPHHSADTPLQTIPSLLHTTTNPCYLLEPQLPLKSWTIWKKIINSVIHIYLSLAKHNNKTGEWGSHKLTINNYYYSTILPVHMILRAWWKRQPFVFI